MPGRTIEARQLAGLICYACDGTLATTARFTNIRVVCNNTLAVALSNGSSAVKLVHSSSFDVQAVKKQLDLSLSWWDSSMYRMKMLTERRVKSHEAENYFARIFTEPAMTANGLSNERAMKKMMVLYQGDGKGAQMTSSKGTAFGLLNAVTEYVDHERRARLTDHWLESAWFRPGRQLNKKALDQALILASWPSMLI